MQLCHFADTELGDFAYVMLTSDPVLVAAVYDSVLKMMTLGMMHLPITKMYISVMMYLTYVVD